MPADASWPSFPFALHDRHPGERWELVGFRAGGSGGSCRGGAGKESRDERVRMLQADVGTKMDCFYERNLWCSVYIVSSVWFLS